VSGRTLVTAGYLFLAALAAPALVAAQSPAPGAETTPPPPASNQPPSSTPAPPTLDTPPTEGTAAPDPAAPEATYRRKHDRRGGKGNPDANAAASSPVRIVNFDYKPDPVRIGVGDTITWTNEDSEPHTATANNGSFDTHTLKKGESGSHTFSQDATVRYTCIIHPDMKGTVVVGSGGGGGGGGSGGSAGTSGGGGSLSEAAAGSSPGAAGTSSSLPATGQNVLPLAVVGALLVSAGLVLRRRADLYP
jgi:LPXTG-motif cell wall-anchored protein